jgi:hypothetical protein
VGDRFYLACPLRTSSPQKRLERPIEIILQGLQEYTQGRPFDGRLLPVQGGDQRSGGGIRYVVSGTRSMIDGVAASSREKGNGVGRGSSAIGFQ